MTSRQPDKLTTQLTIRVTDSLRRQLQALAKSERRTVGDVTRWLLQDAVARTKEEAR